MPRIYSSDVNSGQAYLVKTMETATVTIDTETRSEIKRRLSSLEEEERIRILYAVESGSRAWGFPSRDSDYDVRFIYINPLEWYLSVSLESKRDVMERPLEQGFDVDGWDARKALKLIFKSNPPFLEWLDSSIVYWEQYDFASRLRDLRATYFSPQACAYHYLHMAQGNYRTYLRQSSVWLKKYFYVLRPLLAVRWIEQGRGIVPMLFTRLLETVEGEAQLLREVNWLLQRKMAGDELDEGPSIPPIQEFIDYELSRMEALKVEGMRARVDPEELDRLFRETLQKAWKPAIG